MIGYLLSKQWNQYEASMGSIKKLIMQQSKVELIEKPVQISTGAIFEASGIKYIDRRNQKTNK